MTLTITELKVFERDAANGGYFGYVTAYNGATAQTLNPIDNVTERVLKEGVVAKDLTLKPGESRKILFPGAWGQSFTMKGVFSAEQMPETMPTITYTMTGKTGTQTLYTTQSSAGLGFDMPDGDHVTPNDCKLPDNAQSAKQIVFGNALPICNVFCKKVTDAGTENEVEEVTDSQVWTTFKEAMAYVIGHEGGTIASDATDAEKAAYNKGKENKKGTGDVSRYTIAMLVDYLVPAGDVLNIPDGYDVTFTTAAWDDTIPFTGMGTNDGKAWATISRDAGNSGASIISKSNKLAVNNIIFDGLAVAGNGNGGAINLVKENAVVFVSDCEFKGYRANRGGAVYIDNKQGKLTVKDSKFTNCQTAPTTSEDKLGGGAIWTTAKVLIVENCSFDSCAATAGIAQAGGVFHNIQSNWSNGSTTTITGCSFKNCYAVGGSGGTVESDALDITIQGCSFDGSYTNKSGGSGGAINTYANNVASTPTYCIMRVIDCTFDNCRAKNGGAMGGSVRCSTHDLILSGCIFRNSQGITGGAVAMTNSNAKKVEIYGCTFENCTATNGGAVSAPAPTVILGTNEDYNNKYGTETGITLGSQFHDGTDNDGNNHFTDCSANRGGGIDNAKNNASVSMQNVNFTRCEAKTSGGGALFTYAKTLSITSTSNTFKNTFKDCTGQGSGGGVYQYTNNTNDVADSTARLTNCTFDGCKAENSGNGGGMYTNARMVYVNIDESGNVVADSSGIFKNCTAQSGGGGLYHSNGNTSVTIANCDFENCTASGAQGGGLYTNTKALTIQGTGEDKSAFTGCTAQTGGGGVYQSRAETDTIVKFEHCSFDHCVTNGGNGGAICTLTKKELTLTDCAISNSTAPANGGGICVSNGPTTSFDSCTLSGNTVTNTDSKGAGIYIGGGTVTYKDSVTFDCTATGNGGGIYLNNGTLNIYGGVVHGSATNGGGIYQLPNNTINQYGGQVGGTATANGGGVYKYNGTYNLGGSTPFEGVTYSGGSIGGAITVPNAAVETDAATGVETPVSKTFTSSAVNGGGVYQNAGTFNLNAGGSIGGTVATIEQNGSAINTTGAVNGGGIYRYAGSLNFNGGVVQNCTATENGGGIYNYSGDLNCYGPEDSTVTIDHCEAKNGGGIYQLQGTLNLGESGKTSKGIISNCTATENGGGVYMTGTGTFNLRNTSKINDCVANGSGGGVYADSSNFYIYDSGTIENCVAAADVQDADGQTVYAFNSSNLGGGVYHAGGNFYFYANGGKVDSCSAYSGGGIYHAAGAETMGDSGNNNRYGQITGCSAEQYGGGIYHAGGTLQIKNDKNSHATSITGNTAKTGAGVYVENGASTNDLNVLDVLGGSIAQNSASVAGGGIAVGGGNTRLNFQGTVTVWDNTMESGAKKCNVYLDQDSNGIINTTATALNAASRIGVYASDDQDSKHGVSGAHFGTYASSTNFKCFVNDRRPYLYGVLGTADDDNATPIDWAVFKCKITDAKGNLLYTDAEGTPAVYVKLENNGGSGTDSAFGTLMNADPGLYRKVTNTDETTGEETVTWEPVEDNYQVQMLVPRYEQTQRIVLRSGINVTLTTASTKEDECGFKYTGGVKETEAVVIRHANFGSMIETKGGNLTLSSIIIDGGYEEGYTTVAVNNVNDGKGGILQLSGSSIVNINAKATLRNSYINQNHTNKPGGGAVRMNDTSTLNLNGGVIDKCGILSNVDNWGGGVGVSWGCTLNINGGSITNCSAKNGGGVRVDGTLNMDGGTITGNDATADGGGISIGKDNAQINFKGACIVKDNTLNGSSRCNLQINRNPIDIIKANGLDAKSEIGVYTALGTNRTRYGSENMPFGTWTSDANLHCFVNDYYTNLRGGKVESDDAQKIYWLASPILEVTKEVPSDWRADRDVEFSFTVKLLDTTFTSGHNNFGGMDFNRDGEATVTLKAGQTKTAVLPTDYIVQQKQYTVTENLTPDQLADYATEIEKDGIAYDPTQSLPEGLGIEESEIPYTVYGTLGENINGTETSTSKSAVVFTNTPHTGSLTVSNSVSSIESSDLTKDFPFILQLDELDDAAIGKAYAAVRRDQDGNRTAVLARFDGQRQYAFTLKNGESITIGVPVALDEGESIPADGLPIDMPYTVTEDLTDDEALTYRTKASVDGDEAQLTLSRDGTVGSIASGTEPKTYTSTVAFSNSRMDIVCKITNASRQLLYYRAGSELVACVYDNLKDAFDRVNAGELRTAQDGSASGTFRIEMVVPEYTMEEPVTLNRGKTVILSTALTTDDDRYPYNDGIEDGAGNVAVVYRGFDGGAMIVDRGALTVDKIILDGCSTPPQAEEGETQLERRAASGNGGIIRVDNSVKLTVNAAAVLRNSVVEDTEATDEETGETNAVPGLGGAIWMKDGSQMVMNGFIENCSASEGGGVYAVDGFKSINMAGSIKNCETTAGNGGAVYAGTNTSAYGITLNTGATMQGNSAAGNGGAIASKAGVKMNAGNIGGTEENEGNTATGNGGGIWLDAGAAFTMASGAIGGNTALNGGGLYVQGEAKKISGSFSGNKAIAVTEGEGDGQTTVGGLGGALYAAEGAVLIISSTTASFSGNTARIGGAVYHDGSDMEMKKGSMTGNSAIEAGGAVYLADGKTFAMSGGSVTGNSSPQGAIASGTGSVIAFSGNAVVRDNMGVPAGSEDSVPMNVYLNYDRNDMIRTGSLGSSASIGVYVANGESETADDGTVTSATPIYDDHGIPGRIFAVYTGTGAPGSGARLNKFVNDRLYPDNRAFEGTKTTLTGMAGAQIPEGSADASAGTYYVVWPGMGLKLKVCKVNEQETTTDQSVSGAQFTLKAIDESVGEGAYTQVWSGTSNSSGVVTIPWGVAQSEGGNKATFLPGSQYRLEEMASAGSAVRPAGAWTVTVGRDNSLTWSYTSSDAVAVNRILTIDTSLTHYLGDEVDVLNDVEPTITYDPNGDESKPARLSRLGDNETREKAVEFKPDETNHAYTVDETNPTRPSNVFRTWATLQEKPEIEDAAALTDEELKQAQAEKGYYEYAQGQEITFYRRSIAQDEQNPDDPAVKYGEGKSGGDMTLYAQWEPVVCKITDVSDRLLYVDGNPAVYMSLKDAFDDFNTKNFTVAPNGSKGTPRKIKMLLEEYTMTEPVELANRKTAILTTALNDTDRNYPGPSKICTIKRGSVEGSMITNLFNLTLTNITLDGGGVTVDADGGIVSVDNSYAVLKVSSGATLKNSKVSGDGGAVYGAANTTITVNGGTITDCEAMNGGAVYGVANSTITLSGGSITGCKAVSGGAVYGEGKVDLSGTTMTGNNATNYGGGLYLSEDSTLSMRGGTIGGSGNANTAQYGGGIALLGSGTISGGTVQSNTATKDGGGIYAEGGLTMSGGNIGQSDQGNTAVNGAGIYLAGSGTFSGGTIIGNAAENGAGGGLSIAGNATLSGVAITGNTASSGAGVFVLDGATMNMTGGSVTGNTASDEYSGAIDVGGSGARLNFSGNPTVYNNPAQSGQQRNVALTVDSNQVINVTDELGSTAKIGVYAPKTGSSGEGTLYDGHGVPGMPFGHFANGTEDNLGVFINDWDALTYAVSAETGNNIEWATLIARVSNDNGRTWTYHDWLANDKTYTKNVQTIRRGAFDQAASLNGGVIVETLLQTHDRYTTTGEIVLGKNRTVTLRTTDDSTYNPRGFVSTIKRGEFANKAASMFRVNDGTFVITNMMLDGDKANRTDVSANGGLVYVANGGLTIGDGATLQNAVTTGKGGAVYAAAGASVTVTGGAITDNIAANGGGIYADGTAKTADTRNTINVTNGTISNNTATCNGGGLYVRDGRWAELLGVTMSQNKALAMSADSLTNGEHNGCGGAIYVRPTAKVNVASSQAKDSTFTQNDALRAGGGIFVFDNGTLTVTNAILSQNVSACGGGIGGLLKVNITVTNTLLNGNRAIKGDTPIAGNKTIFHNGNGGGIGLQSASTASKLTVIGQKQVDDVSGTLVGNTATNNGGGIFINGNANGVLDGVTVTGNTAVSGGGMYSGSLTLKNGVKITGNATTATIGTDTGDIKAAGGVYLSNGGTLTLAGDSDQNNLTTIDGNYTTTENKSSNLRLPFNNATKDNEGTSVKLTAEFKGKIRVVNPGTIYSTFGSSDDLSYLFDSDNPTTWETVPNITSEDGSRLFGRIESVSGGVRLYWWQEPICKITDGSAVLYLDAECTKKAVYMSLYDSGSLITSAFGALNDTGVNFYKSKDTPYTGSSYFVEMLDDCEINEPVEVNKSGTNRKVITLKTAEKTVKDDLPFRGSGTIAELSPGPLYRKGTYNFLFTLNHDTDLTVKKITVDGGVDYELDDDGHIRFGDDDKPVYKTGSYISPKDGVLFQIGGTACLTLDAEAALQNAYTTHEYGGGAISFGNNSGSGNNRYLTMKAGSKIIRCCAETAQNGKGGVGGAIMAYSAANNHITIEGGNIEDCWAEKGGGAIYLTSANSELTVKGGTIQNCTAAQGGGLYLNDGARMKIGTDVAANGAVTGGQIAFKDNYGTDYASYNDKLNGKDHTGREYKYADGKVPQDIFVAKLTGNPASAITVTGRIQTYVDGATDDQKKAAQGSIWVWAEPGQSTGHYKNAEQFAVFDSGLVKAENNKLVSNMPLTAAETASCNGIAKKIADLREEKLKETLRAFRNALEDETTGNDTGYYLTGTQADVKTQPVTNIYWGPAIDGFDIVFCKIDGNGDPLPGATFTLYVANDAGTAISEPYQVSGEDVTAISGGDPDHDKLAGRDAEHTVTIKVNTGTAADPVEEDREVYDTELGLVVFEKIPPGVYFIKETITDTDAGTVTIGTNRYSLVEEMYRLVVGNKGLYTIHVASRDADGKPVWTEKQEDDTWPSNTVEGSKAVFNETTTTNVYAPNGTGTKTIEVYTVLNVDARTRKVILKKVDGTDYSPLGDTNTVSATPTAKQAQFTVYYADKQTVVRVKNGTDASGKDTYETLENLLSGVSGAFWIGKLPYGTYYLHETSVPSGYRKLTDTNDNWFILTVNENGVGYLQEGDEEGTDKILNKLNPEAAKP